MVRPRLCARPGCGQPAAATLTFQYATRTVALDDLREREPCTIDLCQRHADRLTAPKGWTGDDRRAQSQTTAAPAIDLAEAPTVPRAVARSEPSLYRAS